MGNRIMRENSVILQRPSVRVFIDISSVSQQNSMSHKSPKRVTLSSVRDRR